MGLVIAIACAAVALATMTWLFAIRVDPADLAPHRSRLDQLLERRDIIYDNLRDLRFEQRAGKLSDADYNAVRLALEREAACVLAEIETVTGATASVTTRQARASQTK